MVKVVVGPRTDLADTYVVEGSPVGMTLQYLKHVDGRKVRGYLCDVAVITDPLRRDGGCMGGHHLRPAWRASGFNLE